MIAGFTGRSTLFAVWKGLYWTTNRLREGLAWHFADRTVEGLLQPGRPGDTRGEQKSFKAAQPRVLTSHLPNVADKKVSENSTKRSKILSARVLNYVFKFLELLSFDKTQLINEKICQSLFTRTLKPGRTSTSPIKIRFHRDSSIFFF